MNYEVDEVHTLSSYIAYLSITALTLTLTPTLTLHKSAECTRLPFRSTTVEEYEKPNQKKS